MQRNTKWKTIAKFQAANIKKKMQDPWLLQNLGKNKQKEHYWHNSSKSENIPEA